MPVRVGQVEFTGVRSARTEEARTLVEQRVPDQQGAVFQDLGRDPVTVVMEGDLFGDAVLEAIEKLRTAQAKAEPQLFAADIAIGTELTEVVIEDLKITQISGYRNRYTYTLRLREHVEPPRSAAADVKAVEAGIKADAESWKADTLAATTALNDPSKAGELLEKRPGLLNALSLADLGKSISAKLQQIENSQIGRVFTALKKIDPMKVLKLVQEVRKAGSLGELLEKCVKGGVDVLKETGVDLGAAGALLRAFSGAFDFLRQLSVVADKAVAVAQTVAAIDPVAEIDKALGRGKK